MYVPHAARISRKPISQKALASNAGRRATTMLTPFGLTPASRSKGAALGDEPGQDQGPFEAMMNDLKS